MTNSDDFAPEMLRYVRAWLRARGLKQADAARHIGVSEPTFSNWLAGKQPMKSEYFQQLASLMGITPAQLLHAPADQKTAERYDRVLGIMAAMTDEQLDAWLRMGEATSRPNNKKI